MLQGDGGPHSAAEITVAYVLPKNSILAIKPGKVHFLRFNPLPCFFTKDAFQLLVLYFVLERSVVQI
jgi:hypothetical protein